MKYIVDEARLVDIADAIRGKTGKTDGITLEQMPIEIGGISGGSGGPLQAKTAYPSHSEQIITPDEDYYGLLAVTVEPVPLFPACVMSLSSPYSENQYYYNHDQLPEIPAEVLEEWPYVFIVQSLTSARVYGCKEKPYVHTADDGTTRLTIPDGGRVRYTVNRDASAWMQDAASVVTTSLALLGGGGWSVWWSNFDIPNGSADAEEIYFPASQPQTEQPADTTHFYYNGVRLPAIPADFLAEYPYVVIARGLDSGAVRLYGSKTGFYYYVDSGAGSEKIYVSANRMRSTLDAETNTWGEAETATSSTNLNLTTTWELLWAGQDIPKESVSATDIYFYGTPAVPDPVE